MDGLTVDINKAYVLFSVACLFSLLPPNGVGWISTGLVHTGPSNG